MTQGGEYMQWRRVGRALRVCAGVVVVGVVQRGAGSGSGAETVLRYFHVWTFRGDKVVRWEDFRERAEALAAVGLEG